MKTLTKILGIIFITCIYLLITSNSHVFLFLLKTEPSIECSKLEDIREKRYGVVKNKLSLDEYEKNEKRYFNNQLMYGGKRSPFCKSSNKVAIIVPFRNRHNQMPFFLINIHNLLREHFINYQIFIVEQIGNAKFNRATLFNIGFDVAIKLSNFNCFVFTDIDLIPLSSHVRYDCPTSPRHMSVIVDSLGNKLLYESQFGGVVSMIKDHFLIVNGFSNMFWGWGGEDDDMSLRIRYKGLKISRPFPNEGKYTMNRLNHNSAARNSMNQKLLQTSVQRMNNDGLNMLRYKIVNKEITLLYYMITVNLDDTYNEFLNIGLF